MLTRLEVDGFKNLVHVQVEFGPFTCIAGPNGVGTTIRPIRATCSRASTLRGSSGSAPR